MEKEIHQRAVDIFVKAGAEFPGGGGGGETATSLESVGEGATVTINDGEMTVTSTDPSFNAESYYESGGIYTEVIDEGGTICSSSSSGRWEVLEPIDDDNRRLLAGITVNYFMERGLGLAPYFEFYADGVNSASLTIMPDGNLGVGQVVGGGRDSIKKLHAYDDLPNIAELDPDGGELRELITMFNDLLTELKEAGIMSPDSPR